MTVETPNGLGQAGRALWGEITANYELEQHEMMLLREGCRLSDRLDELAEITAVEGVVLHPDGKPPVMHPAAVEQRQVALTLTRVVASLRLPAGEDGRPQRRGAARGAYGIRGLAG